MVYFKKCFYNQWQVGFMNCGTCNRIRWDHIEILLNTNGKDCQELVEDKESQSGYFKHRDFIKFITKSLEMILEQLTALGHHLPSLQSQKSGTIRMSLLQFSTPKNNTFLTITQGSGNHQQNWSFWNQLATHQRSRYTMTCFSTVTKQRTGHRNLY